MTVYALRKGSTVNATTTTALANANNNINFDCPTNPIFKDTGNLDDTKRLFASITTDDTYSPSFIQQLEGSDSAGTEYTNLENTEGYKIKCYSDYDSKGIRLNALTDSELASNDYFVLIHSDNALKHHFAKITQTLTDDVSGDVFEFEPRLGNQIPKDTKFMVFKGPPTTTTSLVAVSMGVRSTEVTAGSTTYRVNKSYMCSRPYFYFYKDRLDKKNQLDHSTKYYLKYESNSLSSATVNGFSTKTAFVTDADFGFSITDYSSYSIRASLVDNLRVLDDPRNAASSTKQTSNEGLTAVNNDFTDYNKCFLHARRPTANATTSITGGSAMLGPTRYAHYSFSPSKANSAPFVISTTMKESVGGRGGYAEAKMIDTLRIMPSKINDFDSFRIRHQVHNGHFFEWFPLKATISANVSGNEYTFSVDGDYDLSNLLTVNEEVRVGDRVLRVSAIDSLNTTADTQDITFTDDSRLETSKVFSDSPYTLSSDDRLYRRAFSSLNSTLLTTFPIIEGRESDLRVVISDINYEGLEATVTASSTNQKLLTLSFANALGEKFGTPFSALEYVSGDYILEIERFDGEVEEIETEREHGQNMMIISGRDNYSKLISPVVNKNTQFSEDIVYSSSSPFNSLEKVGELVPASSVALFPTILFNLTFDSTKFTLDVNKINNAPVAGDKLYVKYANGIVAYLGEVNNVDIVSLNTRVTLKHFPFAEASYTTTHNEIEIWRETNKNYMFNKALSADNQLSSFATSLTGSADKGLFFESGIKISDDSSLIGTTTSRSSGVDSNAVGFHIHHPSSVNRKDEQFQARLSDGGSNFETFDTVNTLIDFTVLNVSTVDGQTTIEVAPYFPVTLGRVDHNDYDVYDNTYTTIGTTTGASTNPVITSKPYLDITPSSTANIKSQAVEGNPIYVDSIFAGYCLQVTAYEAGTTDLFRLFLDRKHTGYSSAATVSVLTSASSGLSDYVSKNTHNLYLINGEHLHGGKYVTLLNSMYGATAGAYQKPMYYNFKRPTTALTNSLMATYAERFGPSLFKLNHIEKGDFNRKTQTIVQDVYARTGSHASAGELDEYALTTDSNYYGGGSKIQYYCSGNKLSHGQFSASSASGFLTTALQIIPSRIKETAHPHLPIEERGTFPASGSLFWDYNIYEDGHTKPTVFTSTDPTKGGLIKSNYYVKDFMEQIDPKVARLFLFATSDLMPYSKTRTDSLFYSNRDLKQFKLFLLNEPNEDEFSTKHSKYGGAGISKKILDTDYQSANIIDYDVSDVSKIKTFGLMRLTEIMFDSAFNQIDPENLPDKKKIIRPFTYDFYTIEEVRNVGGGALTVASTTASGLSTNGNVDHGNVGNVVQGDILCDSNGNMIGEVESAVTSNIGFYAPNDGANKVALTNSNSTVIAVGAALFKATLHSSTVKGHGDSDNFNIFNKEIHPLKGLLHGGIYTSPAFTHAMTEAFTAPTNGSATSGVDATHHYSNLVLPLTFGTATLSTDKTAHSSLYFKALDALPYASEGDATADAFLQFGIFGVVLDRFDVDGGTSDPMTSSGTVFPPNDNTHLRSYSGGTLVNMGLSLRPNVFRHQYGTDNNGTNSKKSSDSTDAEGIYMGFKLRVNLPTAESPAIDGPSGTTHYKYILNSSTYPYLDYVKDLTGCYLVSEKGSEYGSATDSSNGVAVGQTAAIFTDSTCDFDPTTGSDADKRIITHDANSNIVAGLSVSGDGIPVGAIISSITDSTHFVISANTTGSAVTNGTLTFTFIDTQPPAINNIIPDSIGYVITHEIDTGNSTKRHIILTDFELPTGYYRVMQPNQTCTHSFSPKKLKLNTITSEYTKMPYKEETYSEIKPYLSKFENSNRLVDVIGGTTTLGDTENIGLNEGVLSMYAIVNLDGRDSNLGLDQPTYVVDRFPLISLYNFFDTSQLKAEIGNAICVSDGNTSFKTSLDFNYEPPKGTSLTFGKQKELDGVVSISEILTITTNNNIKGNPKRAMIGSVATICSETEDIINNLLEENDIEFTSSYEEDYPLFLAPNYQGIDLFSAINYLVERKNKKLVYENSKFSLTDHDTSNANSKLFITDRNNNLEIRDFSKSKVLFDFYNEVIVYGSGFKSRRQNQRSIRKRGRKTLEVDDETLATQPDVDRRAAELLRLHSSLNEKITVELGHLNFSQIKAGDIVTLELLQENVEISDYLILQMEHNMHGFVKLSLGKFSKGLTDRFAEIALDSKKTSAALRPKIFKEVNNSLSSFELLNVKEVKLFIRKRSGSTGGTSFNIGFSQTIGFGGVIGFSSTGSTSETTILETEL